MEGGGRRRTGQGTDGKKKQYRRRKEVGESGIEKVKRERERERGGVRERCDRGDGKIRRGDRK